MRLSKRDLIATGLVSVAALVWVLWLVDAALPGLDSARATAVTILVLGFIASAAAVVPTFTNLLHGNKVYLVITSVLGLVALTGGVLVLVTGNPAGLSMLATATVVLWVIATVHHRQLERSEGSVRPV